MSNTVDTKIGNRSLSFTFTDNSGEVVSSFSINPADLKLSIRCNDAISALEKHITRKIKSAKELSEFFVNFENQIAGIVESDPKDIFGKISAVTVLETGELFGTVVLRTIKKAIEDEAKKRKANRMSALNKYTQEYKENPHTGLAPGQTI